MSSLLTVGEMPGVSVEQARLYTDPARAEVDMVFQFEHVQVDQGDSKWDLHPLRLLDLKASMSRWQEGLADVGWNSLYWNNHDQPRVVSRFGDDGEHRVTAAKMLGTVLHLHRGTPYVYQGEELGMTNAPFNTIEDFRDIESLNHYAEAVADGASPDDVLLSLRKMGRDNARTPMQWDAGPHAGFTTGEPWLGVNPNHAEINAEAARADPDSVFHHYRQLIELRHALPVVAHGDFTMLLEDDERVYAFTRAYEGDELLVLGNFSGDEVTVEVPGWEDAEAIIGAPGLHPRPMGRAGIPKSRNCVNCGRGEVVVADQHERLTAVAQPRPEREALDVVERDPELVEVEQRPLQRFAADQRHEVELDRVPGVRRADRERALHRDQEVRVERKQFHDAVDRERGRRHGRLRDRVGLVDPLAVEPADWAGRSAGSAPGCRSATVAAGPSWTSAFSVAVKRWRPSGVTPALSKPRFCRTPCVGRREERRAAPGATAWKRPSRP